MKPTREHRKKDHKPSVYYRFYKKSGLLSFLYSNILKVLAIIAAIGVIAWLIDTYVIKIESIPQFIIDNFDTEIVLLFFLLTESVMGLIPPDLFILWVSGFKDTFYLWVGILGVISYFGGFNAYFIGSLIKKLPKINTWAEKMYAEHLDKIKKWGDIFIIISALLPLPYAIVCSLTGVIKYPKRRLAVIGLFRIARFYIYAPIILQFT